ncbi:hypothetical protein SEA_SKOG_199 [Gordonia phage Skog]|uniref:Uncharacterized protein n=1 Tax=Gordonia phage Skog TaxID=2704033 RepID=A0A6G6XJR4_9CAUD|nr:hypothetical protein KHQ85_gp199 [Gordonia phage Skog]QIG58351.1 hypothetical protein SEA_SKOG_199 [Gordonia phage Skog]
MKTRRQKTRLLLRSTTATKEYLFHIFSDSPPVEDEGDPRVQFDPIEARVTTVDDKVMKVVLTGPRVFRNGRLAKTSSGRATFWRYPQPVPPSRSGTAPMMPTVDHSRTFPNMPEVVSTLLIEYFDNMKEAARR